jgi:hypothetical protein
MHPRKNEFSIEHFSIRGPIMSHDIHDLENGRILGHATTRNSPELSLKEEKKKKKSNMQSAYQWSHNGVGTGAQSDLGLDDGHRPFCCASCAYASQ